MGTEIQKTAENLAETLAAGNFTADGQIIKAKNGIAQLNLRLGSDNVFQLLNDLAYAKSWYYGDLVSTQLGYSLNFLLKADSNSIDFEAVGSFYHATGRVQGLRDIATQFAGTVSTLFIVDNAASDRVQGASSNFAVFLNSGGPAGAEVKAGVNRSVLVGGDGLTAKTDNTAYVNQVSFQEIGVLFDCIIKSITATADRTHSLQNKSGTLAHLDDITSIESFTSTDQTITSAGSLTIAHGLSGVPNLMQYYLVCQVAEHNYSIGDLLRISSDAANANNMSMAVVTDATNIKVRFGSGSPVFKGLDFTSGGNVNLTNASWEVRFIATIL